MRCLYTSEMLKRMTNEQPTHCPPTPPRVLTIAGSDSGGSAGIQADLKTFTARGVFGMSALTLVTAQNTTGVQQLQALPLDFIAAQIEAVLGDIGADTIKTGLLLRPEIIDMLAAQLPERPLIVDPVLVNGAGQQIVSDAAVEAYQKRLFPRAHIITPNLDETKRLTGMETIKSEDDFRTAAKRLHAFGASYVLLKGSIAHVDNVVRDYLYDGEHFWQWEHPTLPVQNPHGIGCTFASAIAAEIAKGSPTPSAVATALDYVHRALQGAHHWQLGAGRSPVNHFVDL